MPVYNQERYLQRSLKSVLAQSYRNLEVIVVNDGSKDNSLLIIEEYAKRDNRIRVVNKNNGGVVSANHAGIIHANGEYICFLDPDDYVGNDFVKTFHDNIGNCDAVAFGFFEHRIDGDKEILLDDNVIFQGTVLDTIKEDFISAKNSRNGISKALFVSKWNKMYKASVLKRIADQYLSYSNLSEGEDAVFLFLILHNSDSVAVFSRSNSYYYDVSSSSSMTYTGSVQKHLDASKKAFVAFNKLSGEYGYDSFASYYLFFMLLEPNIQRTKTDKVSFSNAYRILRKDKLYKASLKRIIKRSKGRFKQDLFLRLVIPFPRIYLFLRKASHK